MPRNWPVDLAFSTFIRQQGVLHEARFLVAVRVELFQEGQQVLRYRGNGRVIGRGNLLPAGSECD